NPSVGWGLVVAETLQQLPAPIQALAAKRQAPVFRYRANWEHSFSILLNPDTGVDVDITGSRRGIGSGALPHYLLIYGPPTEVPWRLQYVLGANRAVGRIDLEGEALAHYVDALLNDFR